MLASRFVSRSVSVYSSASPARFFAAEAPARKAESDEYEIKFYSHSNGTSSAELENGVRVLIAPREDDPSTSIGVYVQTGSAYEGQTYHGATHFHRRFLYKGTNRVSGLRITRCIENLTSDFSVTLGREQLAYETTLNPANTNDVLHLLGDVLRPRVPEWEFLEVRDLVKSDIEARKSDFVNSLGDKLRSTAFRGAGLGRSPLCPEYNFPNITDLLVRDWINSYVVGPRITVIVSGNVPQSPKAIAENVAPAFGGFVGEIDTSLPQEKSEYFGGEVYENADENVYVEAYKGVSSTDPKFPQQIILASLLGDYSKTFAQPGKNNLARLNNDLQKNSDGVTYASSFNTWDSQTLFGIRAKGGSLQSIGNFVHSSLKRLADSKVSADELKQAKGKVLSGISRYASTRYGNLGVLEQSFNNENSWDLESVNSVTAEQLQSLAQTILKSPRTVIARGDLSSLPKF